MTSRLLALLFALPCAVGAAPIDYRCTDGQVLSIDFVNPPDRPGEARITGPGGEFTLIQEVSASGALYQRGPVTLHTKGRELVLDRGTDNPRQCRQIHSSGSFVELSGQVTYLARIALPPQATMTLRIEDRRPASRTRLLAEQYYALEGAQVPIPFASTLDRDLIHPAARLYLTARIEADGRRLFDGSRAIGHDELRDGGPLQLILRPARGSRR